MPSVIELQKDGFATLEELCSSLGEEEWSRPTECPGWDVKDNLSHVIGTESILLDRQAPDHDPGQPEHVKNPIGATNEVWVGYYRSWAPAKVLEEYRQVTAERVKALDGTSEADLDGESWTPVGQGTLRDLIAIRIMDIWVHEQDIRRAVGKPGNLEGPVAAHVFSRHASAMPYVVGKKAEAPDGATVVFEVTGFGTVPIGVDGRAKQLDSTPESPDVTLTMDLETFNRLCCGRGDPSEVGASVAISGDRELGARVVQNMDFMV